MNEQEFKASQRAALRLVGRARYPLAWRMPSKATRPRQVDVARGERVTRQFRGELGETRYNKEGAWALPIGEKPRRFVEPTLTVGADYKQGPHGRLDRDLARGKWKGEA